MKNEKKERNERKKKKERNEKKKKKERNERKKKTRFCREETFVEKKNVRRNNQGNNE